MNEDSLQTVSTQKDKDTRLSSNAIFMICVGSVASVIGFGYTFLQSKRNEIKEITSQSTPKAVREQMAQMRDGTRLASRALAYSWLWSIGGVSLLSYSAWKLSGARDLNEFRKAAGKALPAIPKAETSGRNDFDSLKDLADFLEDEDKKQSNQGTQDDVDVTNK